MIEKFEKSLERGGEYATLLMDLTKIFDCLPHDLIIAKLYAYRIDKASLRLVHSYLTDRYERESKSIFHIAFGVSSNMECLEVQFWVP